MDSGVRWVKVFSSMWKEMGWNSIVFFSAITAIDQELYEAARIDGANRFKQMLHVTLPGIAPTVVMTFIIRIGHIFDAGFGQVFAMYNATVMDVADILGTYIYRMGLGRTDFSLGVTVGLFESVIGLILVVLANKLTKKWVGKGMW
ncbi:MAG: ABC transporter permease subunit [Lachnospiraceae bacterium]